MLMTDHSQQPVCRSLLGASGAGFHQLAWWDWGHRQAGRPVVCVHGLTRNARDFDALAANLAGMVRVACPDVVGRGRSDWLRNPDLYGYPQYIADCTALIAALGVAEVDWVGTSMGGLIGMLMASLPGSPIRRLVLNDVGPFIPQASLERIGSYVGADPVFASVAELEQDMRRTYAAFGDLGEAGWGHLARHSARQRPDGTFGYAYDPGIGKAFRTQPVGDVDLWAVWDSIGCEVLVIRGAQSDLLLPDTARRMAARPRTRLVEIADVGHAPALLDPAQVGLVREFLLG